MEQAHENLLDFIDQGIAYQLANGKIQLWNKAAERIVGLSAEEAERLTSTNHQGDLLYEDGSPCPGPEHPSMITLRTGRSFSDEVRGVRHADGRVVWLSISTAPVIMPGDSKPSAVAIWFRNITGRKLGKQSQVLAATRYAIASRLAKMGHWIRDFNQDEAEWSPELFSIFGRDPSKGAPSLEEFFNVLVHPEDRKVLRKSVQHTLGGGQPMYIEYRIIRPDGEVRYVRSLGEAQAGRDDKPSLMIGFLQDVTEYKLLEQEIRSAKAILENVYACLEEAVLVINPETRVIISCNAAAEKIFGYTEEEIIGQTTQFLHVNEKAYKEFAAKLYNSLNEKGIFQIEYKGRKKDGTIVNTTHTINEIKNEKGQRVLMISVVRDITEQKRVMKELRQKSKELSAKAVSLEELNIALKVMLEHREQEKRNLEEGFALSINSMILPYLERIRKTKLSPLQEEYLSILERSLKDITRPYVHRISDKLILLSPAEARVANYVKQGCGNKEIASMLNVSLRTVEFHRNNIRNKLGIKNRKINLRTYLADMS